MQNSVNENSVMNSTTVPKKVRGPYKRHAPLKPAMTTVGARLEKSLVLEFEQALAQMGIDRKSDFLKPIIEEAMRDAIAQVQP